MPVIFVRKAPINDDPILMAAARMHGKVKKAFLDAIKAMQGTVNLSKLADAIAKGDSNAALAILAVDQKFTRVLEGHAIESNILSFQDAIQKTYTEAAKAAMTKLPTRLSLEMSFNVLSPQSISFLDSYSFDLIQQISEQTRESIRAVISRAFKEGGHPFVQAREIRDSIGLTANQEQAVANYRNALSGGGNLRNALNRALRDGRFDSTVQRAISGGTTISQSQIDKMVGRYRERFINYRAQTIARTETIRASNMGQREVWRQARDQGLLDEDVQRVWIVSGDDATCDECSDLDGETAGLDEEFDPGVLEPPLHPDCRCTVALQFDVTKFDDNEARDEHGRWTSGGGEISGSDFEHSPDPASLVQVVGRRGPALASEIYTTIGYVTPEEKSSLADYKSFGYEKVNTYLITGKAANAYIKADAKNIKAVMQRATLSQSVTVYRGVNGRQAQRLEALEPGTVGKFPCYQSTTTSRSLGEDFANGKEGHAVNFGAGAGSPTLLHISVPNGYHAIPLAKMSGYAETEKELLLDRRGTFRVTSNDVIGGMRHIHLEVSR